MPRFSNVAFTVFRVQDLLMRTSAGLAPQKHVESYPVKEDQGHTPETALEHVRESMGYGAAPATFMVYRGALHSIPPSAPLVHVAG